MSQATASTALGSGLGAINSTFRTIGNTFDTLGTGINMAHAFVSKAANNQKTRYTLQESSFEEQLLDEISVQDTLRQITVVEFTKQSPTHEQLFKANRERLKLILRPE